MTDEHTETGTGWPRPAGTGRESGSAGTSDPRKGTPVPDELDPLVGDEPTVAVPTQPTPVQAPPAPVQAQPTPVQAQLTPVPAQPAPVTAREPVPDDDPGATIDLSAHAPVAPAGPPAAVAERAAVRVPVSGRLSSAGVMIAVLLALLGFTLVVQLRTTSTDPTLAATRQEDLVRILSDLESQEQRLREDVSGLEESQRQLNSGAEGRQAALEEATRRADELGILAGTLPVSGPGLDVRFTSGERPIRAATLLDAVQELRGAGAEAMQISGGDRAAVRIVASTYFLDPARDESGIVVDGRRLTGPFTITVIGDPATMRTALNIPGGVVASVNGDGGNVIVQEREAAEVSAVHAPTELKHARPVS